MPGNHLLDLCMQLTTHPPAPLQIQSRHQAAAARHLDVLREELCSLRAPFLLAWQLSLLICMLHADPSALGLGTGEQEGTVESCSIKSTPAGGSDNSEAAETAAASSASGEQQHQRAAHGFAEHVLRQLLDTIDECAAATTTNSNGDEDTVPGLGDAGAALLSRVRGACAEGRWRVSAVLPACRPEPWLLPGTHVRCSEWG